MHKQFKGTPIADYTENHTLLTSEAIARNLISKISRHSSSVRVDEQWNQTTTFTAVCKATDRGNRTLTKISVPLPHSLP